jgi:hypothetical protein
MPHATGRPFVVNDNEGSNGSNCPCIHWVAATLIQKRSRGWLVSICYEEFQQCRKEMVPKHHHIYMAKVRIVLRLQGQWHKDE